MGLNKSLTLEENIKKAVEKLVHQGVILRAPPETIFDFLSPAFFYIKGKKFTWPQISRNKMILWRQKHCPNTKQGDDTDQSFK